MPYATGQHQRGRVAGGWSSITQTLYHWSSTPCESRLSAGAARGRLSAMRVLVLGGGVVGVTTAYYLAREGCEVELVEGAGELATHARSAERRGGKEGR